MNREQMINLLKQSKQIVTFTKVDGTERVMECTLNPTLMPQDQQPVEPKPKLDGTPKKDNDTVVRAYAFDVQSWRSFRVDSVKTFTIA